MCDRYFGFGPGPLGPYTPDTRTPGSIRRFGGFLAMPWLLLLQVVGDLGGIPTMSVDLKSKTTKKSCILPTLTLTYRWTVFRFVDSSALGTVWIAKRTHSGDTFRWGIGSFAGNEKWRTGTRDRFRTQGVCVWVTLITE